MRLESTSEARRWVRTMDRSPSTASVRTSTGWCTTPTGPASGASPCAREDQVPRGPDPTHGPDLENPIQLEAAGTWSGLSLSTLIPRPKYGPFGTLPEEGYSTPIHAGKVSLILSLVAHELVGYQGMGPAGAVARPRTAMSSAIILRRGFM